MLKKFSNTSSKSKTDRQTDDLNILAKTVLLLTDVYEDVRKYIKILIKGNERHGCSIEKIEYSIDALVAIII